MAERGNNQSKEDTANTDEFLGMKLLTWTLKLFKIPLFWRERGNGIT